MKGIANQLTPELVREYHGDVLAEVNASLITCEDMDPFIKGVETLQAMAPGPVKMIIELLDRFEIFDAVEFLKTTAVTMPTKRLGTFIYIPWVPGDNSSFGLASQAEIISHEGQHVVQANKDPDWLKNYILKFAKRCEAERKAFQTSMEVFVLMHGYLPEIKHMTGSLAPYFLRPTDEEVLWAGLEAIRAPTASGARATEMGKFAARWFRERTK
jgi:hypothetical protein